MLIAQHTIRQGGVLSDRATLSSVLVTGNNKQYSGGCSNALVVPEK
ncbi:hypothetical protein [Lacimicrobium alkaliphilum]|nr:hypothetical protein [Lacimicrobium alkaliphilum]